METPCLFPLGGLQMSSSAHSKLHYSSQPPPTWFPNSSTIVSIILSVNTLFYVLYIFITEDNGETSVLGSSV